MSPFEEERVYCFAHVGLSVTFSFLINKALTYILQTLFTHPSLVPDELLSNLEVTGSKVKVSGVKCVKTVSNQ